MCGSRENKSSESFWVVLKIINQYKLTGLSQDSSTAVKGFVTQMGSV